MTNLIENKFKNRDALFDQLCFDVIERLEAGIGERSSASMLLSGGTTPGPLYEKMSHADIDWKRIYFAPTDERWVAPDHPDSNEKLIRETLLQNKAAAANYIGLKSDGDDPFVGQAATERKLEELPRPFDVVLLGMGEDGHFASLFPGLDDTQDAMAGELTDLCHGIRRGAGDVDRMTMTLNCLLSAKRIILLFYGTKKLAVLEQAKNERSETLPVSYLLHQNQVPVSLYWAE